MGATVGNNNDNVVNHDGSIQRNGWARCVYDLVWEVCLRGYQVLVAIGFGTRLAIKGLYQVACGVVEAFAYAVLAVQIVFAAILEKALYEGQSIYHAPNMDVPLA